MILREILSGQDDGHSTGTLSIVLLFLISLWRPEFSSSPNSCHSTHQSNFRTGSSFTKLSHVRKISCNNLQLNEVPPCPYKISISPIILITQSAEPAAALIKLPVHEHICLEISGAFTEESKGHLLTCSPGSLSEMFHSVLIQRWLLNDSQQVIKYEVVDSFIVCWKKRLLMGTSQFPASHSTTNTNNVPLRLFF